jgi:hypothetical protein
VRLPKIITRGRAKWAGLAASLCVAAAIVASYWYWPSYEWIRRNSIVAWTVRVEPGALNVTRSTLGTRTGERFIQHWSLRSRHDMQIPVVGTLPFFFRKPPPIVWLPRYNAANRNAGTWKNVAVPLWMPLVLVAVPTGILFYRDRRVPPGCCTRCRYDLAGLSGNLCPECGTPISPAP